MKKAIIMLAALILASCDNAATSVRGLMGAREGVVYVCTGPMSQCYHTSPNCKGPERCSKTIEAVGMAEAIQAGRRACKFCR